MRPIYKIIIIAIIAVLVILGAWFAWTKIFSNPSPTATPTTENGSSLPVTPGNGSSGTSGETQTSQNGIILKKLVSDPVFAFWETPEGTYYITKAGSVYVLKTSSLSNAPLQVSSETITALNTVEVAPGNKKILASFGSPQTPQWGVYDTSDKSWHPLPQEISNATWGGTDTELIALVQIKGNNSLASVDISKNPPVYKIFLQDVRLEDTTLHFTAPQTIYISEKPLNSYSSRVWQLDTKTLSFNLLVQGESGSFLRWSSNNQSIFRFSSPDKFLILDSNFQQKIITPLTTFPEKCDRASDASTTFCFVPQTLSPNNIPNPVLPDDYLKNKFYTTDDVYAVSDSGNTTKILSGGNDIIPALDADKVLYANKKLYFINRYDNALYELTLPS